MRIFLTGATGFIGTALIPDLLAAGHQVLGLARSDAGAQALRAAGAEVHRGDLADPGSLTRGAEQAEGVIHAAFDHDFSRFQENCEKDVRAINALGTALAGSDRPLLITSGTAVADAPAGQLAREDMFNPDHPNPRKASEIAGQALLQQGMNLSVVRLPQVHDPLKQGLITPLIQMAREKGVSAYVGDGSNRWQAVHVSDAVRVYRLALERGVAGARYHPVAEQGVAMRDIADVIGRGLNLPVVSLTPAEAAAHFGWLGMFAAADMPASGAWTQQVLGWHPTGPTLLADLEKMAFAAA